MNIDYTFKSNSGPGGWLTSLDAEKYDGVQSFTAKRVLYDFAFLALIVVIMVNIVSGIIIDTFGALRNSENDKNDDIKDKCFVCGNLKLEFDRLADT